MRIDGTVGDSRQANFRPATLAALLDVAGATSALAQPLAPHPYADLSLEEFDNVVITSVTRRPQAPAAAASSVYLITGDDLRRSGVLTLPEALRLAPTLQVAALNAHEYAITTRGFASNIANKLPVMIDGRTVYSPQFSGVFWDAQDLVIDDIDRIEVISGPGGATWGTNAVNGVINIVTRSAADTQGVLAKAGAPTRNAAAPRAMASRSAPPATPGPMRSTTRRMRRRASPAERRPTDGNARRSAFASTRARRPAATHCKATSTTTTAGPTTVRCSVRSRCRAVCRAVMCGRWSHRLADDADFDVQAYYDRTDRTDNFLLQEGPSCSTSKPRALRDRRPSLADRRRLPACEGPFGPRRLFRVRAAHRTMDWTSVFVQDEVGIGRDVQMTLGTRFERNPYTGWEVLPSARLGRSVTPQHFVWTSLSRAVRSPARLDREIVFPPQPPYLIAGGPTFEAEIARTADLGYRGQPSSRFSWSATAFATDYRKLRSAPIDPQGPITIANGLEGQVRGLEAAAQWQVTRPWRLRAGLVLLDKDLRRVAGSNDPVGPSNLGNDPKHQWSLRSSHNLGERVEFDAALHGAGALPQPVVPAYTAVDLRLLWRVRDGVEVSFVARNASDPGHVEYRADPATSEIARSILLAFRWLLP